MVYSPKTVTHPGTNRARRALTSFMQRTPLTSTPRHHPAKGRSCQKTQQPLRSHARLRDDTSAHRALRRQIGISLGRLSVRSQLETSSRSVAQEASGWIRFAGTTISVHPLICGDVLFVDVILSRDNKVEKTLSSPYYFTGWLGSRVVSVLDSGAEGPGFKSQPRRCRVTVLGKLFTPVVPLFTRQRKLVATLLRVARVTAGLAESNGSLSPGL